MEYLQDGKLSDDSRLYDPRSDDCSRGPLSFAELNKGGPFVMCADKIEGSSSPAKFSISIVATDGKKPYSALLTPAVAEKIRSRNNLIPGDEWASLLLWIFVHEDTFKSGELREKYEYPLIFLKGLKDHNKTYLISIEHYVDCFTNVLGTVEFKYDDNPLISPMRWVSDSVREYIIVQKQLRDSKKELAIAQKQIDNLGNQIQEFLKKKDESEILILEKMRILLNEKKQKIHELGGDADKGLDFEYNVNIKEERPTTPKKRFRSTRTSRQSKSKKRTAVEDDSGSEIDETSPHTPKFRSEVADGLLRQSPLSGTQRPWRRANTISSSQTASPTKKSSASDKDSRDRSNSNGGKPLKHERSESADNMSTESDVVTEQSTEDG
ncbi:uncharacterized protein V1513DRAFT_443807 [Lipomyces chichibuensis]|uniref:uncharacterized protein n=1 Tax=Lipomyces chichibuensis TaxID=1546026 RepID=UPI0033431C62